jgi:RNA-binding protein
MDQAEKLKLRAKAQSLPAKMNIGKSGLTEGVVEEVRRQLEEDRLLKVKLLASAREEASREALAQELAERTGAELVEVRGNTAVLWRGRAARRPRQAGAEGAGDRAPGARRDAR